jgi:hypothetical protein
MRNNVTVIIIIIIIIITDPWQSHLEMKIYREWKHLG